MPVIQDPEGNEARFLREYAGKLAGKRVLEIGCGEGRLSWQLAESADYLVAIDPDSEDIAAARGAIPPELAGKIEFQATSLEAFTSPYLFDTAVLSWSF